MISVIVPIYNTEKYLDKCITSIVNQTHKNLEIILVDDGSTDSSLEICRSWAKKDSRIVVLHKENGGQGSARNMALDIAKGDYIGFVDSDDWIEANMYEVLYANLLKYDADISCCKGTTVKNLDGKIKVYNQPDIMLAHQTLEIKQSPCDKIYKKDLFDDVRFPKSRAYEDCATIYKLLAKSKVVVDINLAYYHYELRENSTMTRAFDERKLYLITAYKEMYDFYKENYPQYADMVNVKLVGAVQYCVGEILNTKDRGLYKKHRDHIKKIEKNICKKGLSYKHKLLLRMICFCPNIYKMIYKHFK